MMPKEYSVLLRNFTKPFDDKFGHILKVAIKIEEKNDQNTRKIGTYVFPNLT